MIEFDEHVAEKRWLDMTPMIDVVFLLLIFFLLTSIFSRPAIPLNLPAAASATVQPEQELVVTVKRDGSVLLNGQRLELPGLADALTVNFGETARRSISLHSDRGVPFGRVVEVMDVAKQAGAETIAVAADQKP